MRRLVKILYAEHCSVDFWIWFRNPHFHQKKGRLFLYATWGWSDDRNNSTSVFFRFMASEKMSNRSKIGSLEASRRLLEVRPLKKYGPKNDQKWPKPKQNQRGKVVLFFDGSADMLRYRYPVQKSTVLLRKLIPALRWKATNLCFPTRRRSQSSEQYSRWYNMKGQHVSLTLSKWK